MSERAWIEERMAGTGISWATDCGICGQVPAWVATHESYWKDKGGHVRTMLSTGPLCAEHRRETAMLRDDGFDKTWAGAMANLQAEYAVAADRLKAAWVEIEPHIRRWVAQCDRLSESTWMDQPESTREMYVKLKAVLAEIDAAGE